MNQSHASTETNQPTHRQDSLESPTQATYLQRSSTLSLATNEIHDQTCPVLVEVRETTSPSAVEVRLPPLDMIDSQDGVLTRQENHSREICNPSTPVGTADLTTVKD